MANEALDETIDETGLDPGDDPGDDRTRTTVKTTWDNERGGYPRYGEPPVNRTGVVVGVLVTLGLHIALVGAVVLGTMQSEKGLEEQIDAKMLEFEEVELLALGEEKPPEALPRIANPEPEVQAPDEINLAKPKEPVVELEKKEEKKKETVKEDAEERKKRMADALSALHNPDRPTNEDAPAGGAEGVVGGSVSDAAMANLMGTYQAKLIGEISRVWDVPSTVPAGEIDQLSGQVEVYVELYKSGHIKSYQVRRASSNEQFNESIERVLRRFQLTGGGRALPMPDNEEVREAVVRQGLNLKGWEYTGR